MNEEYVSDSATMAASNPATTKKLKRNFRAKTSLRIQYEAQSQASLKKLGGLSGIQKLAHLNQRKLCQILMVDPSSWSRWIADESKVPPHIVRACEWYLALINRSPELIPNLEKTLAKDLPDENLGENLSDQNLSGENLRDQISRIESAIQNILDLGTQKTFKKQDFLVGALFGSLFLSIIFIILKHI